MNPSLNTIAYRYSNYLFRLMAFRGVAIALLLILFSVSLPAFSSGEIAASFNISARAFVRSPNTHEIYASTGNDSVVIINLDSLSITDTIAVGQSPAGLAVSEDGATLYVALSGASELAMVNLKSKAVSKISLPGPASDVEVGKENLYVSLRCDTFYYSVLPINLATYQVPAAYCGNLIAKGPLLEISPDKNSLYIANRGISPGSFYKFDVSNNPGNLVSESPFASLGDSGVDFSLSPNGRLVYYTTGSGNRLLGDSRTVQFASDGFLPLGSFDERGWQITASPYGNFFYQDFGRGISVWDANSFSLISRYQADEAAVDLIVDQSGNYLLAAFSNELRIYRAETNSPDVSVLGFGAANYSVKEADGNVVVTVSRNNSQGVVSVDYFTEDATALAGKDYKAVSGTLTFAAGQTTASFTLPLIKDAQLEASESLLLKLRNPSNAAVLSTPALVRLTIQGDVLTGNYFPLAQGSQWFYQANNQTYLVNVPYESVIINKSKTRTLKSNLNNSKQYFTNDANGLLLHRLSVANVWVPGLGKRTVTLTAKPAIVLSPPNGEIGKTFNSAGNFHEVIEGGGSGSVPFSTSFSIQGGETITVPAGTFSTLKLRGTFYIGGEFLLSQTYYLADGIGIVRTVSTDNYESITSELQSTNVASRDMAVTAIMVPNKVTLSANTPSTVKTLKVVVQNRSMVTETINDVESLQKFIDLNVESLGSCAAPTVQLLSNKYQGRMPISIKPKKTFSVEYSAVFNCANDKLANTRGNLDHSDYRYTATIDRRALDGHADVHQEDDVCPRQVAAPYLDQYPDYNIKDAGCGGKLPNKTFGADVITDVIGP